MKKFTSLTQLETPEIFEDLLQGVLDEEKQHLKELFQDACRKHYHLFDDKFWFKDLDGDMLIEYILPCIRRVFASFFIQTPNLFGQDPKRLELFQLQFNLEEFLIEIKTKLMNNIDKLNDFENLDKASTLLHIIVENYVAGKINLTKVTNPTQMIRQIKLEKHLKI